MTAETAAAAGADAAGLEPVVPRAVILSLTTKDLAHSVAWYRDVLGFTVDYVREQDGKPASAGIRSGAAKIFLNQDDGGRGWTRVKGEGFAITFETMQDVDAIADRIRARGGSITMAPADMPWGVCMVKLTDPDGFRLAVWRPLDT